MAIKRPKPEEIVVKLRQVEVLTASGNATLNAAGDLTADVETHGDAELDAGGTMTAELEVTGNSVLVSGGGLTMSGTSTNLTTTSDGLTSFGSTTLAGALNVNAGQNVQFRGAINAQTLSVSEDGQITQPAGSNNINRGPNRSLLER